MSSLSGLIHKDEPKINPDFLGKPKVAIDPFLFAKQEPKGVPLLSFLEEQGNQNRRRLFFMKLIEEIFGFLNKEESGGQVAICRCGKPLLDSYKYCPWCGLPRK
jgi:hypothetical protein